MVLVSPALSPFVPDLCRAGWDAAEAGSPAWLCCELPLEQINISALSTFSSLICLLKPEMFLVVTVNTDAGTVGAHTPLLHCMCYTTSCFEVAIALPFFPQVFLSLIKNPKTDQKSFQFNSAILNPFHSFCWT